MSTDTIQRSIFKMNPDFWYQRAPPNNGIQNLSMTSPDSNLGSHQSSNEDVKYSQMKEFNEMKEFADIKNYTQKFDDFKAYTEKIYTQQEKYNSHVDKFDKYANNQEMNDVDKNSQPRSTPNETAQNLTSEGFKSSEAFPQNSYKLPNRTTPNTPDMSPPAASLLQNLSTEQLRNIQSTLASFGQTNDVRNIQANAIQNLSTHIQNVLPPNALSPNEIRNLQSLAISNLSTQVQSMTNANLNMGDIRNLTTIAVQNLTNHIENLRNQSANLTPNEVRNLTTVAVNNLTNHIQNLNQMNQPIPSGISANELPRNLAAFQQLANPVQTNLGIRNFTNNLSAMQNLTSLSGMSNNIAAVSAVLSAAAAQQAALSSQNTNQSAQNSENPQPEGVEPEISNGSNSASAANNNAGGGSGSGGGSSTPGAVQGSSNNAASSAMVPVGSGSNSNTEKGNSNDLPSRSNSAISNQTLEECWSTLQRIFMHKSAMQLHARDLHRSEIKPHQCQQCLKSFSSNHQLVQHIRVHTGEKPYKCSYCDRRFKQLSHVQQHTRLHTGERPYKCHLPECGRAFIQLSNLQQHLRNHDAQVERAKNRPFHCSICGKGFATESSLRTHTSKSSAQPRSIRREPQRGCYSQPFGTSSDERPQPSSRFVIASDTSSNGSRQNKRREPTDRSQQRKQLRLGSPVRDCPSEQREALMGIPLTSLEPRLHEMSQLGNAHNPAHAALLGSQNAVTCPLCHKLFLGGENLMEHMKHTHKDPNASGVATKRRTANHPCPICGKHYVNEGSLRKHLACHPETSQFSSSLRMWPCSVCQAVFTHESGLLSHMEHMRMDPKHQFAAQYVLSRAAAERRERESLIAAAVAASNAGSFGIGAGQPVNSLCPSPAPSDSSSMEHLSSTGSETGNIANNNNNNKLDMSHISPSMNAVRPSSPRSVEYNDIPNRMAALNAAIAQAQNMQTDTEQPVGTNKEFLNSQEKFNMESNGLQITPSNLIMRNSPQSNDNNNEIHPSPNDIKPDIYSKDMSTPRNDMTPAHAQQLAVNAMRANLENMRNIESLTGIRPGYLDNPLGGQQQQSDSVFRIQQQAAEALLRSQAEAALRLAVSQAAAAVSNERNQNNIHNQLSPDLTEALRLQEQRLEQALRLHGDPRVLGFSLNNPNSNPNTNLNANNNMNNT